MNVPSAWSFTSLDDFENCPRAFYEKRVIKSVKEEPSEQMLWGNKVHKSFELFVKGEADLPEMFSSHENYLLALKRQGDVRFTERKIALDKSARPCSFFDKNVWYRGVIDFHSLNGSVAQVVDYKTGKRKPKFKQVKMFAIWIFTEYPQIQSVNVSFYWTQTRDIDHILIHRREIPEVWNEFIPSLKQYARAFKDDIWPERPSGLCGWCPVKQCKHWKQRRG